jgi:hypothetical protein
MSELVGGLGLIVFLGLLVSSLVAQALRHWSSTALDLAGAAVMAVVLVVCVVDGNWFGVAASTLCVLLGLAMFVGHRLDRHGPVDLRTEATDE